MTYWTERKPGELWQIMDGADLRAEVWRGPAAGWLWEAYLAGGAVRDRAKTPQAAMAAAEECLRRHGRLPGEGGGE